MNDDEISKAKDSVIEALKESLATKDLALRDKETIIQMKDKQLSKAKAKIKKLSNAYKQGKGQGQMDDNESSDGSIISQQSSINTDVHMLHLVIMIVKETPAWTSTFEVLTNQGVKTQWQILVRIASTNEVVLYVCNWSGKDIVADVKVEMLGKMLEVVFRNGERFKFMPLMMTGAEFNEMVRSLDSIEASIETIVHSIEDK